MGNRKTALSIRNLTVSYRQRSIWLEAVSDFSMDIAPGQVYGLVGESGSGKSTVALAVMGYLSQNGRIDAGEILFGERDIVQLSRANMRDLWGEQITLVPQNPLSSLNPSLRIGDQIEEVLRQHRRMSRDAAQARAIELLDMVRVPNPARVARSYPHEISGGMQQRALIAMALSTEPSLLVLDEPTTGLDVTTQAAVLDLLRDLIEGRQTSVLYVTHNLGVVARICDRVAVMYAGELVEDGPVDELFADPIHPYTMGLLESVPHVRRSRQDIQLEAIPGQIPSLGDRVDGCIFAPRCWAAIERCSQARPPVESPSAERYVRCIRWDELVEGLSAATSEKSVAEPIGRSPNGDDALLAIEDLQVHFEMGRSVGDMLHGRPGEVVKAVDGVNLRLMKGQALGIVGESGSGKTSLARAVVGLAAWTSGEISLMGLSLPRRLDERPLALRKLLQYVFQNPEEALNPYMTVGQTLKRPLVKLWRQSDEEAALGATKLLEAVQLPADYVGRLPDQLSGGEKQRVAIARAFATQPELLIADEPVSSLDVSVQASILNLLRELQAENQNTLIFISHDLAVVGYVSHVVAVMYAGCIMEVAPARSLFEPPYHPYTEALLSAIPSLDPADQDEPIQLPGDVPSQKTEQGGCPFHPRCPRLLGEICRTEAPPWRQLEGGGSIFCHIHLEELSTLQKQGARASSKAIQ